jgi:hypothetical protein
MRQGMERVEPHTAATRGSAQPLQKQDSGLGTTYERWALNRFLERLQRTYAFHSVLEGPGDGITGIAGINSLGLGRSGVRVTVLSTDPRQAAFASQIWRQYAPGNCQPQLLLQDPPGSLDGFDTQFDLVWNFNVANRHPHPRQLLEAMCRASKQYVLVVVPNRKNYAFPLHRLHHRVTRQEWDHGPVSLLAAAPYRQTFTALGLRIREVSFVDCPWWPDIVDFGTLVSDFFPFLKRAARGLKPENRLVWPADRLPYYEPERYAPLHRQMRRLSCFERCPVAFVKQRFAHHVAILAEKEPGCAR